MATKVAEAGTYEVYEMRGGSMVIRNYATATEVFFQPGDDAQKLRDCLAALEEIDGRGAKDRAMHILCSEYF